LCVRWHVSRWHATPSVKRKKPRRPPQRNETRREREENRSSLFYGRPLQECTVFGSGRPILSLPTSLIDRGIGDTKYILCLIKQNTNRKPQKRGTGVPHLLSLIRLKTPCAIEPPLWAQ
jgi:hypothetical protein